MKIEFHHYHHIGAETLAFLLDNIQSETNRRLQFIQETLIKMTEQEKLLGEKLDAIQQEQRAANARGEQRIEELTQLVKDLKEKADAESVDLTDEIAKAEAILQTERESFPVVSDLPVDPPTPPPAESDESE